MDTASVEASELWERVTALRYGGRIYARVALANLIGAALVAVQGIILSRPAGRGHNHFASDTLVSSLVAVAYLAVAVPVDVVLGLRRSSRTFAWVDERRAPTEAEQVATLRYPCAQTADIFCWWVG